jgi:YesN/AraC family two-component response regulator
MGTVRWQPEAIDLLVTDVAMSPMMGTDLAKLLVDQKPNLKVIFVSG